MGVVRYNLHRSTTNGFTPSAANRIAQPTGTSATRTARSRPAPTTTRVTAEDAAGNISAASRNRRPRVVTGDITAPTAPRLAGHRRRTSSVALTLDGRRPTTSASCATTSTARPRTASRRARPTGSRSRPGISYTDSRPRRRHLLLPRHRRGRRRQHQRRLRPGERGRRPPQPPGLVAAYGFDEGSGTTRRRPVRQRQQRHDRERDLDGRAASTATRSPSTARTPRSPSPTRASLDLTTGMTIEAWVNPTALGTGWRTVDRSRSRPGNLTLRPLREHERRRGRTRRSFVGGSDRNVDGTAPARARTRGRTSRPPTTARRSRLYVNGTQVGDARRQTGAIATSTGALRIGGNTVWGEWFQGLIDEVRIYNRALSATEIQADMNTSDQHAGHDRRRPRPATLDGDRRRSGTVTLSWTAATDNVGVARYNVHRGTTRRLHADRGEPDRAADRDELHRHGARRRHLLLPRDRRGRGRQRQRRPRTRRAATATADTTPPTVSMTAPAGGATVAGTTTVTASASDNVAVAGVQFKLDGANLGSRGHDRAVLRRLGHADDDERLAHAHRGRARRRRATRRRRRRSS